MTRSSASASDPVSAAQDRTGVLVAGRFRLSRRLGAGAMGDVFLATHEGLGNLVAVKILRSAARAASRARFRREATIAARLSGVHVVRVTDFGELPDGSPFLVMDYVDGPTLADELGRLGRLPAEEAVGLALEVCEALAEAHRAGIVHRDIKPANLLLARAPDGSRVLRVADFGVAKAEGESTLTGDGASLGSPSYMAPEQITDPHGVDARADLWAIGVVLYELLSGFRPFDGPTVPATLLAVSTQDPPPLDGVPLGLAAVVRRCLERSPEARFASAAELATALVAFGPVHAGESAARISRVGRASSADAAATTADPEGPRGDVASGATTVTGGVTTPREEPPRKTVAGPPRSRRWAPALLAVGLSALLAVGISKRPASRSTEAKVAPLSASSFSLAELAPSTGELARHGGSPLPPSDPSAAHATDLGERSPPSTAPARSGVESTPRLSPSARRVPQARASTRDAVPPMPPPVPAVEARPPRGTEVDDLGPRR